MMDRLHSLPALPATAARPALLRPHSVRWHLVALALAALLPALVLSGVLTVRHTLAQRTTQEEGLRDTASALALAIDADLGGIVHTLEGAAVAAGPPGEDPVRFLTTAAALKDGHPYWHALFLADGYGHVTIDTASGVGALRKTAALPYGAAIRQAIATGKPAVSSYLPAEGERPALVAVAVPLLHRGLVDGVIGVAVRPERWSRLLAERGTPADWLGVVLDQGGTLVARAPDGAHYAGRVAPDWLAAALRTAPQGLASGRSLQGHDVTLGYARSAFGWSLGFAAPQETLDAPLARALTEALLLNGALVTLAALAALRIGRRIAAPVRALTAAAVGLEQDRPLPPIPPSSVREINDLGAALAWAAHRLHEGAVERERLLEREAERRREAERANAAKSRFLAAASHDLRQPFQAMRLYHFLLDQGLADERARDIHRQLGTAMESGESLLNALLDVSTVESGTVQPRLADMPVRDLVAAKLAEVRLAADAKGLRLRSRACGATVRSDPLLLGRILGNLLANAVRYTGRGGVLVACRRRAGALRIEVWDTGAGIPPEQLETVFEEFVQLGNPARDHSQGRGLGLSVVRRTARLLGHPLEVRSVPGRGSCFAITVPLATGRAP
ncbi:MAG TPA: sensor histidine kinase [Azospirillum sp.]|nr:sensor histidine kinase [Azospirillum sp.]